MTALLASKKTWLVLPLLLAGVGCGASPQPVSVSAPNTDATVHLLNSLEVKGRVPMTGYDRREFGNGWGDPDHNGCDTRNDVLARDLEGETFKAGTHDCVVLTGTLNEPYTGKTVEFERGQGTSSLVQIDHVVALGDAWQTGAQTWNVEKREDFANDPAELLAVDGRSNSQKGAGDAATWLPPNKAYRCAYVGRQIEIKVKYDLWLKAAEKKAMENVLATC